MCVCMCVYIYIYMRLRRRARSPTSTSCWPTSPARRPISTTINTDNGKHTSVTTATNNDDKIY